MGSPSQPVPSAGSTFHSTFGNEAVTFLKAWPVWIITALPWLTSSIPWLIRQCFTKHLPWISRKPQGLKVEREAEGACDLSSDVLSRSGVGPRERSGFLLRVGDVAPVVEESLHWLFSDASPISPQVLKTIPTGLPSHKCTSMASLWGAVTSFCRCTRMGTWWRNWKSWGSALRC